MSSRPLGLSKQPKGVSGFEEKSSSRKMEKNNGTQKEKAFRDLLIVGTLEKCAC